MDVQVDGDLIRAEREKRAWSQEHLAGAAGIGARTVQRIESTGVASYESARAISAALEIPVGKLRAGDAYAQPPLSASAGGSPAQSAATGSAPAALLRIALLRWLGAALALALLAGMSGFLLMQDYRKVRVLRTVEHWVTEAAPSAQNAKPPDAR